MVLRQRMYFIHALLMTQRRIALVASCSEGQAGRHLTLPGTNDVQSYWSLVCCRASMKSSCDRAGDKLRTTTLHRSGFRAELPYMASHEARFLKVSRSICSGSSPVHNRRSSSWSGVIGRTMTGHMKDGKLPVPHFVHHEAQEGATGRETATHPQKTPPVGADFRLPQQFLTAARQQTQCMHARTLPLLILCTHALELNARRFNRTFRCLLRRLPATTRSAMRTWTSCPSSERQGSPSLHPSTRTHWTGERLHPGTVPIQSTEFMLVIKSYLHACVWWLP